MLDNIKAHCFHICYQIHLRWNLATHAPYSSLLVAPAPLVPTHVQALPASEPVPILEEDPQDEYNHDMARAIVASLTTLDAEELAHARQSFMHTLKADKLLCQLIALSQFLVCQGLPKLAGVLLIV